MFNESTKKSATLTLAGKEITVETGEVAKQARGSVLVRCGDTVVLVTACISHDPKAGADFLPLTVDYRERTYAAGKIPGGFFKREMRPREKETLISRLIDRSVRPHFPEGLHHEIQVSIMLLSIDKDNDPDMLGMLGASFALGLSDIPWNGPIAAVRIGRVNDQFVVNPTVEEQESSTLNLVVAGRKGSPVMIEGGANEISEAQLVDALTLAQEKIDELCAWQEGFFRENAKHDKLTFEVAKLDDKVRADMEAKIGGRLKAALRVPEKLQREDAIANLRSEAMKELKTSHPDHLPFAPALIEDIIYREVRRMILEDNVRPDGRPYNLVRQLTSTVGVLPRAHGSALFTRGQTQSLATATLGTPSDMQIVDDILGEYKDRFMLHYNFPSFSTGEARGDRSPGRREIGHGNLARRSLEPLLPSLDSFPYTIRVVSDIMESNGSSSMASVCGGSLALFDAGVPLKAPCAGIAMGLVKEGDKVAVLTDIIGLEDFMGDMDFKVAGSRAGITAVQMDIKIQGVTMDVMRVALERAREARMHILDHMETTLSAKREELSEYAPRMETVDIPIDKIGALIGPGGKNIRALQEETGANIEVDDDGRVYISSTNADSVNAAKAIVEGMSAVPEVGKVYKGKVMRIMPRLGAFVQFMPGKDGLVHISQLAHRRVERVEDEVKEGDEFDVKVMEVDSQGRVNLSRKALLPVPEGYVEKKSRIRDRATAETEARDEVISVADPHIDDAIKTAKDVLAKPKAMNGKGTDRLEELIRLMTEEGLQELELRDGSFHVRLVRQHAPLADAVMVPRPAPKAAKKKTSAVEVEDSRFAPVKSPLAGVFYRASSPQGAPFVKEGDKVTSDKTLCIIEAMKVLNEINAGASGRIAKILVENGKPVQNGQPLFLIEPD